MAAGRTPRMRTRTKRPCRQLSCDRASRGEARGQDDEDTGDQDGGNALLEPPHLLDRGEPGIGDDQAENRHRHQAGFARQGVRSGKADQDRGEDERRLHRFGHPAAPEGARQAESEGHAEGGPDHRAEGQRPGGAQPVLAHRRLTDRLEDEDREQRPDRVVDDPFPFQHRGDARFELGLAQEGQDDGRPGNGEQGADHRGEVEGETGDIVQGQGGEQPVEGHAEKHQPPDRLHHPAQLAEIQRDSALKQDHADRQRDHRAQIAAEALFRVEQGLAGRQA